MTLPEAPALHLAFASLHVLVGHFLSAAIHRIRFGANPLVLHGAPDSPHRRVSRALGLFSLLWAAALIATAFSASFRESFLGRPIANLPPLLGWSIAVLGLALMAIAQASMGAAFRVGQDPRRPPEALCESGLHRLSRNPIYVGSWSCLAGMTLWWPGPMLLLSCLAIGAGIHLLVLDEERFLRARFGDRFEAYRRRVPRYLGLPSLGGAL